FDRSDTVERGPGEADADFPAARDRQRQRCDRTREVADPQAVVKIRAASPSRVANLNEVLAGLCEGVREPRIGLKPGSIVAIRAGSKPVARCPGFSPHRVS